MAIIFVQEDTAPTCLAGAHCSGLPVDSVTPIQQFAIESGSAGTTEDVSGNMTNSDSTIYRMLYYDLEIPSSMDGETGAAGNWTVRINHSTGDADVDIEEVHVCHVDSGCAAVVTLGSTTAIATATNGAQPVSVTVNQASSTSITAGDRVVIVVGYQNNATHGNNSIGVTPSVNIDCPWTAPAPSEVLKDIVGGTGVIPFAR